MSSGCASCSGRCCYDIVVRVTPLDIWRIARAQRLAFDEIVVPWREPEPTPAGVQIDATSERYATILGQHPVEAGACAFLMHVGDDVKRCGVYADRPIVCRVYPFVVNKGSIDIRADARCAPTDWNLATLDYGGFRAGFGRYAAEEAAAAVIVRAWNERVASGELAPSFAAYLAFAEAACAAFPHIDGTGASLERWNEALLPDDVVAAHSAWLVAVAAATPRR